MKQDNETVLVRPPETACQETSIKGNVTRRQRIGLGFVGKGRAGDSWPEEYRTTVSGEGALESIWAAGAHAVAMLRGHQREVARKEAP